VYYRSKSTWKEIIMRQVTDVRFEFLTVVRMVIFWVVTPCRLMGKCQFFLGILVSTYESARYQPRRVTSSHTEVLKSLKLKLYHIAQNSYSEL
jgi:hypothetical protein